MTRILVVEDDAAIAMALEDDLKSEGYEVEIVRDGEAAVRRAKDGAFDAILLDLMLPLKDGLEVCRDLRRTGNRTPILMLTARAQEADKVQGLEIGADDYVTKPYSPRELRARVKALIRRSADDAADVYQFGDVSVDFTRCEVRRRDELIDVAPLELKLLRAFIGRRGRVLTRQELIDEAWGQNVFVTDRVVDNQVTRLRKKIEPEPANPRYIVSVRGFGYRFDG